MLDNGSSHTAKHTKTWLAAHPRWHVHWTPPHASWVNQVELFFSGPAPRRCFWRLTPDPGAGPAAAGTRPGRAWRARCRPPR
ncbi:transposase [Streptomyces gobiensis]|uniref:transposase n=1 Tax=Streptomyces gobiensis TaxID=2875706 RepID=UPI003BAE2938